MPICLDRELSGVSAGPEYLIGAPYSQFRESDANCLDIGLINNMPDAALEATERQFLALLDAAAGGIVVPLRPYALPDVTRTDSGRQRVRNFYSGLRELWNSNLDGLIVTGAEPKTADLTAESYWESLVGVLEWAEHNTYSTVWSCLAAHAALLHTDGIRRRALSEKCFGVFQCIQGSDHQLTAGASRLRMPHSRWNDVPENALVECGYRILTRSEAGVDMFVKQRRSLFVFLQGHPEYETNTLLLEYRRDIRRFLRREREIYPPVPRGYFDGKTVEMLAALRDRALRERNEEFLDHFPRAGVGGKLTNTWGSAAVCLYRNWLQYMCAEKTQRLNG